MSDKERIKDPVGINRTEMGYFGNIWVRKNLLFNVGDFSAGHKHKFDHVSLLVKGRLRVEVEGNEPTYFDAPTFVVIRKNHIHKFIADEPNTVYYCVFAIRDLDGEPIDELYGSMHDPLPPHIDKQSASTVSDDYWDKAEELLNKTEELEHAHDHS